MNRYMLFKAKEAAKTKKQPVGPIEELTLEPHHHHRIDDDEDTATTTTLEGGGGGAPTTIRLYLVHQKHGQTRQKQVYQRCPLALLEGPLAQEVGVLVQDLKLYPQWKVERTVSFPLSAYERVASVLQRVTILPFAPLPVEILRHLRRAVPEPPSDEQLVVKIGTTLWETLRPFQKTALRFATARDGRVLVADDMGLGKTLEALSIAAYYRDDGPILIVCPSSLRYGWSDHVDRFASEHWQSEEVVVVKNGKQIWHTTRTRILILTYGLLLQEPIMQRLLAMRFATVILDESHMIKESTSKRTKQCQRLCAQARHRLLLSGTPMPKCPMELFSQLQAIDPQFFPLFWPYRQQANDVRFYFSKRYCAPVQQVPYGYKHTGSTHEVELNLILKRHIMIRRLKYEVLQELPKKTRERLVLGELEGEALSRMQSKMLQINAVCRDDGERLGNPMFLDLVRRTTVQKTPLVLDYIREVIVPRLEADPTFKCLLFGNAHSLMDAMQQEMEKTPYGFIRIDGSVAPQKRHTLVERFQNDASQRVALLSLCAAGVGLTLTKASLVVMAEMLFGLDTMVQAEDRSHRIGQENDVQVVYLIIKGSTDDQLFRILQKKSATQGRVLHNRVEKFMAPETHLPNKRPRSEEPIEAVTAEALVVVQADDEEEPPTKEEGEPVVRVMSSASPPPDKKRARLMQDYFCIL